MFGIARIATVKWVLPVVTPKISNAVVTAETRVSSTLKAWVRNAAIMAALSLCVVLFARYQSTQTLQKTTLVASVFTLGVITRYLGGRGRAHPLVYLAPYVLASVAWCIDGFVLHLGFARWHFVAAGVATLVCEVLPARWAFTPIVNLVVSSWVLMVKVVLVALLPKLLPIVVRWMW